MSDVEVWRRIFRACYTGLAPTEVQPAEAYAKFYRGHHGPCDLRWDTKVARWAFPACPHVGMADVCAAHQGFTLGLLDAALGRDVVLADWTNEEKSRCLLTITWEEP